jgi:hypothetical protein
MTAEVDPVEVERALREDGALLIAWGAWEMNGDPPGPLRHGEVGKRALQAADLIKKLMVENNRAQLVGDLIVSRKDLVAMMDKADRAEAAEVERLTNDLMIERAVWLEGAIASGQDKGLRDNPYPLASADWIRWRWGWLLNLEQYGPCATLTDYFWPGINEPGNQGHPSSWKQRALAAEARLASLQGGREH